MTALHQVLGSTKKILITLGILLVIIIFIPLILGISKSIKEKLFPTPIPPPTVGFGKLPRIVFPEQTIDKKLTYTVDTISGMLPPFTDRVAVYSIHEEKPTLFSLQRAQKKVAQIGFTEKETPLSETLYQWTDSTPPVRQLTFDIISSHFDLTSQFLTDSTVLETKPILLNEQAVNMSLSFLSSLSLPVGDIDAKKTKITLFTIQNRELITASSLSETDIMRVDFFQNDSNKLPIFYSNPPFSNTYALIAGGNVNGQIVEAHYHHFAITDSSATYPIKTADEAFLELQQQKAYIASYFGEGNLVKIKNVYLGYFASESDQKYLMPIIVFEGDNRFYAYVSAIKNEWFSN